jgi:hypothetical protein
MERIQWEETPRLGVSEGIRLRISIKESTPILSSDNLKRVMERIQREETPRLGVSKGIR